MTRTSTSRATSVAALLEASLAALLFLWIIANPGVRALLAGCFRAQWDGLCSSVLLTTVDAGTLVTILGVLARVVFLVGPPARLLALSPRHRLAWTPLLVIVWVAMLGVSVPAMYNTMMWALLGVTAAGAWLAAARPKLGVLAFAPWLVVLEPMVGHSPLSDTFWSRERLSERCAANDGVRPVDLTPAFEISRYYAVTAAAPDAYLLTGERLSFWVRRGTDGALRLGTPLWFAGNMWAGCVRDDRAWVTSRHYGLCEAPIPRGDEPPPRAICHKAPGSPELGVELDYVDAICPPDRPTVYSSQLLRGGYLELDPRTDATTWHAVIPGMNLQMVPRRDGKLLAITTGRFVVFDPDADRVLEEHPAGIVAMGIDVCSADDAVAITDFTGRLRLFERGADGQYVLRQAAFARAPRRVAFSPSCAHLVVTSGDDRHAYLVRRRDLATVRAWELGPGLRDVTYVDENTVAAADACTMNLLDARP